MSSKSRTLLPILLLIALAWAAAPAAAQTGASAGEGPADLRWFDHFVVSGGWITWVVLLPLSVATVALVVFHAVGIRRATLLPPETERHIAKLLADKRYSDAVGFTADDPSILAGAIHAGLRDAGRGFAAMQRAVTESLEDRAAQLMRKIEYLNVIGNVSPMIGLFGTVYGMIRLFASIRAAGAIPEPAKIADDISIALVTTFWGLAIAIPALTVFALFRNRIDVLIAECALVTDKLLEAFKPGAEPASRSAPSPAPTPQPIPLT